MPAKRGKPPTVRLRRLAAELRRLRDQAGLSREQVEEATGVNTGTLYRIESTHARPQRRTLTALLNLYGVEDPLRSELVTLTQAADDRSWLRPYHAELREEYTAYISFELEARAVRNYESLFIPGLLQTEAYTHAMIQGGLPMASQTQIDQLVQARLERQRLLDAEDSLELWAVIDEATLRRVVGGRKVMRDQVAHLLEAMKRPNVMVQVIPFDVGAHPGMTGSFSIMEFRDPHDPELVYVDTMAGDLFLEGEPEVRRYGSTFDHLRASALAASKTKALLDSVIESLKEG